MGNDERAHKKFPRKVGVAYVTWPYNYWHTIERISKTISASNFKFGMQLRLPGSAYYGLLWGSTVGYHSDSLASCKVADWFWLTFNINKSNICGVDISSSVVFCWVAWLHNKGEVTGNFTLMRHLVQQWKTVKIGVHLRKLSLNLNTVSVFMDNFWYS